MEAVDELVRLFDRGTHREWEPDWSVVEERIGVAMPEDYKGLMAVFPSGIFDGYLELVNPVQSGAMLRQFVRESEDKLDHVREWRRKGTVPHPVVPEPGGIVPWGEGADGQAFFWLPSSDPSAEWSVVYCDEAVSVWGAYNGTVSEFLVDLLGGRTEAGHTLFWLPKGKNPDEWPVVLAPPGLGGLSRFRRSMSSLLVAYLSRIGGDLGMLPDPVEFGHPDRPLFIPGR